MKNTFFFYLIICIFTLVACNKECENEIGECPQEQFERDIQLINSYLEENNLEAESTASGLHYVIKEVGNGTKANIGQTVAVNYVGRFLDGTVFDTSVDSVARSAGIYNEEREYVPIEFSVGRGSVIPGWDEAFLILQEESSATLLIPSSIAYGHRGRGSIPPNSVLIFDVELVEIKF